MTVSSLAHLPEAALTQLLGGMLLSYFRSANSEHAGLYLFRDGELPLGGGYSIRADWIIYDKVRRRPVGAFELVRTMSQFREKQKAIRDLKRHSNPLSPIRVGVVTPESLAPSVGKWTRDHQIELVTYPA